MEKIKLVSPYCKKHIPLVLDVVLETDSTKQLTKVCEYVPGPSLF